MLDIKILREEPEKVKQGISAKNADPGLVDKFLELDKAWREAISNLELKRSEQKKAATARDVEGGKRLKEEVRGLEEEVEKIESRRNETWRLLPNIPLPEVIVGQSEDDNKVLREVGERTKFDFPVKDYTVLADSLNLIDTERATRISGSRFAYLKGDLVRLEFALGQFLFETISNQVILEKIIKENGLNVSAKPFIPVLVPIMINAEAMGAMGYMDRGIEEIYHLEKDDLYLIGTSEQAIGPMHKDEILKKEDLPIRYVGFSPCFRREAGSYGKDTKGILRVHQFNKFEMFSFSLPEFSVEEHKFLLAIEEYLMQKLGLPYQVLDICSADLGDPAASKYDIEAWLPGQNGGQGQYRETHSTSNTTDFQARRLNIRYKNGEKLEFVHLLNGTAFSERPLIAIMENYQTKEGNIRIPEVLQPYLGKTEITS